MKGKPGPGNSAGDRLKRLAYPSSGRSRLGGTLNTYHQRIRLDTSLIKTPLTNPSRHANDWPPGLGLLTAVKTVGTFIHF